MKHFFSLIVPIYNVDVKYIKNIINNIRNQKFKNYELILIDDKSTNKSTIEFLKKIKLKKNEKIIWNKENKSLGCSRNVGINNATGDYIVFIDPDDSICDNFLEVLHNNIINNNYPDTIHFNFKYLLNEGIVSNENRINLSKSISIYGQMSWLFCINLKFLRNNDLYFMSEKIIHEDEFFIILLLSKDPRILIIDNELYIYNKTNENSIMTISSAEKSFDSLSKIANKISNIKIHNENFYRYIIFFLSYPISFLYYKEKKVTFRIFLQISKNFNIFSKKVKNSLFFKQDTKIKKLRKIYISYRYCKPYIFFIYLMIKLKRK